jgi:hypothetical protein
MAHLTVSMPPPLILRLLPVAPQKYGVAPVENHWSRLIFCICSIRILAGISAILTGGFRGFPRALQGNTGILFRLGHNRFHPNPFQFISNRLIRRYVVSVV